MAASVVSIYDELINSVDKVEWSDSEMEIDSISRRDQGEGEPTAFELQSQPM